MKLLSIVLLTVLSLGCGYKANSSTGTQPSTNPNITGLAPTSATAGGTDFVLTVNGTGFTGSSSVYWNSAIVSTTYVSPNQLTAAITAADIAASGTASVYVNNPGTGIYMSGVNSATVDFTIQ